VQRHACATPFRLNWTLRGHCGERARPLLLLFMKIACVCGSLQEESSNLRLLRDILRCAPTNEEIHIEDTIRYLPLFNPDISEEAQPATVKDWRSSLAISDGLIIACPEYGHSLPGALKNAIDWVIGTGEFYKKPVAITASTKHPARGLLGLSALAQTLLAVDADIT